MNVLKIGEDQAILEFSSEELGLVANALWQELGYQEPRREPIDDELRDAYDALQQAIVAVLGRIHGGAPPFAH